MYTCIYIYIIFRTFEDGELESSRFNKLRLAPNKKMSGCPGLGIGASSRVRMVQKSGEKTTWDGAKTRRK